MRNVRCINNLTLVFRRNDGHHCIQLNPKTRLVFVFFLLAIFCGFFAVFFFTSSFDSFCFLFLVFECDCNGTNYQWLKLMCVNKRAVNMLTIKTCSLVSFHVETFIHFLIYLISIFHLEVHSMCIFLLQFSSWLKCFFGFLSFLCCAVIEFHIEVKIECRYL